MNIISACDGQTDRRTDGIDVTKTKIHEKIYTAFSYDVSNEQQ